jgi:arylsulfatase A-like enzyme
MNILAMIGRQVVALVSTLLVITLLIGLFITYRALTFEQVDDEERLAHKRVYLESIAATAGDLSGAPNIVFILYDDMGYGDFGAGATGNTMIRTPHIDALAADGVVLSDFHSPAPVCTPSRAGFLTGRLAARAGLPNVVFPSDSPTAFLSRTLLGPDVNQRLPAEEITLAEVLQAAGYRTGMVGKWHLGDHRPSLPNDLGFDHYFGALYSNDMEPFALYRDREVEVPAPADQRYLTEAYTREATAFIEASAGERFFLYLAHNFPHIPLFVRDERSGQSDAGLYGDVLEELDESIGAMVAALKSSGQHENTLIIITSDNGPWYLGDSGNLRGRKGNTFEGGMRVPFIAHWPYGIPPGRTEGAMAMGTDLLPTVLDLLDLPSPSDRILDGRSILPVLTRGAATPHDYLYYYDGERLFAVRDQRFKYRGPAGVFYATDQMPIGGAFGSQKEWLFDLENDPRESYDTADRHPQALERLRQAFESKQEEMAVNPRGWD